MLEYEFVNKLSNNQIVNLSEMYIQERWSKNRELADIQRMLENSWIIAIINLNNGEIIAFARALSDFVYRTFIYDIIVAKKYRGLKFGKLIVNSVINHNDFKNVERLEVYCVDSNVQFYEKLGFGKVSDGINLMRYNSNKI